MEVHVYKITSKKNYLKTQEYLFKKGFAWRNGEKHLLYLENFQLDPQQNKFIIVDVDQEYFIRTFLPKNENIKKNCERWFENKKVVIKTLENQLNLF